MTEKKKRKPYRRIPESEVVAEIQKEASRLGHRLFRNNVGLSKRGDRVIAYGLCKGSSDLIGWTKDGRFLAIECKAPHGFVSRAQNLFIDAVTNAGGVAGVARSVSDFHDILRAGVERWEKIEKELAKLPTISRGLVRPS